MTFPTLEFTGESHFGLSTAMEVIRGQDFREIRIRITDLFWKRVTFRADVPRLIVSSVVDRAGKTMYTINQASLEVWGARAIAACTAYYVFKKIWIF